MKGRKLIYNLSRGFAAVIMLQTLFFKFTAADESVYIFSTLGVEPWGRILSGLMELLASVLLFVPAASWLGALLGSGIMAGAILSHLTVLGVSVKDDHGYLFFLACLVMICCLVVLRMRWNDIPFLKRNNKITTD